MEIYKKQTLAETFSVYFDRRMIKILLLGAISDGMAKKLKNTIKIAKKQQSRNPIELT